MSLHPVQTGISWLVVAEVIVITLIGVEFAPAGVGVLQPAKSGPPIVHQGVAGGKRVVRQGAVAAMQAVPELLANQAPGRWSGDQAHQQDIAPSRKRAAADQGPSRGGKLCWDDDIAPGDAAMYTDWTAVILLLLTAIPLVVVVTTAAFFIWRQKRTSR
jgi:hypothetical protein